VTNPFELALLYGTSRPKIPALLIESRGGFVLNLPARVPCRDYGECCDSDAAAATVA
jgi:hypothetical protein